MADIEAIRKQHAGAGWAARGSMICSLLAEIDRLREKAEMGEAVVETMIDSNTARARLSREMAVLKAESDELRELWHEMRESRWLMYRLFLAANKAKRIAQRERTEHYMCASRQLAENAKLREDQEHGGQQIKRLTKILGDTVDYATGLKSVLREIADGDQDPAFTARACLSRNQEGET